jgi:cation-transporting ATPase E
LTAPNTDPVRGLTSAQVAERMAHGQVDRASEGTGRTVADIVRANVFTFFNGLLGALFVVMVVFGSIRDALFGLLLVVNTGIGIFQEVRAKRTLERLRLLSSPAARVVRDGAAAEVAVEDVVLGDLLAVSAGDQLVVDGEVVACDGLEIDESLLTGESVPVLKSTGDPVLSGSFVTAGAGRFVATAVGPDSYANRLAAEGRRFTRVRSELMDGTSTVLRYVTWAIVPVAALSVWAQFRAQHTLAQSVTNTVAALVGMVPEGLVLLTSLAFAVAAIRLARKGVLVQELPAVEVLARVDVVATDKTGTLTEPDLSLSGVEAVDPCSDQEARAALGAVAGAASARNDTVTAIAAAIPPPAGWSATAATPFSSARKYSAVAFEGRGTWLLGAPEVLLPAGDPARLRAAELAAGGDRVLALARTAADLAPDRGTLDGTIPLGLVACALVTLGQRLRPDAPDTLRFFGEQGVALKVVSGDAPETVGAVAARAGVPGALPAVDARNLPTDDAGLEAAMEASATFGRTSPEQKKAMVAALQRRGHVVAMTGDGVNDVPALKAADIGIAMGSGAPATRAVAQIVLLDGRFSTLPDVVAEGRRVMANAERVAHLFLTKTVYAAVLAVVTGLFAVDYPFLPRHLTLAGSLTIGIPAFFLALAPNTQRYRPGFVPRVLTFAIPAGIGAGVTVLAVTAAAHALGADRMQAQTMATVVLTLYGLRIIEILERPLVAWKVALLAAMAAALAAVLAVPFARSFFALALPSWQVATATLAIGAVAVALLGVDWRVTQGPRVRREAS